MYGNKSVFLFGITIAGNEISENKAFKPDARWPMSHHTDWGRQQGEYFNNDISGLKAFYVWHVEFLTNISTPP
jgi:hypothetical protein